MRRKRHSADEIVNKLREVDVELAGGRGEVESQLIREESRIVRWR